MGLGGAGFGAGGRTGFGLGQGPDWGTGEWVGQPENFNIGKEPVQLKVRTRPKALTGSQPLLPGPAMSEDILAPPAPSGSGIPLSQVLPAYAQRAEQALSNQPIPPPERQRVRRYFEALRQGTR
ncbi:MAG: hypothetical protein C4295_10455 [Candidatus Fervidibacterota bacterium]